MKWQEIDFDASTWLLPASLTADGPRDRASKSHREHLLPLAPEAVAILRDLKAEATSESEFVFPSVSPGGLVKAQKELDARPYFAMAVS
jgi:integrase